MYNIDLHRHHIFHVIKMITSKMLDHPAWKSYVSISHFIAYE